jgi:hypothetical protein
MGHALGCEKLLERWQIAERQWTNLKHDVLQSPP